MYAVTLFQPTASEVCCGSMSVVARSFQSWIRGVLVIHAGAKPVAGYPSGAIVGAADLVLSAPYTALQKLTQEYITEDLISVNELLARAKVKVDEYRPYVWVFLRGRHVPKPIRCAGSKRIWSVSDEHRTPELVLLTRQVEHSRKLGSSYPTMKGGQHEVHYE